MHAKNKMAFKEIWYKLGELSYASFLLACKEDNETQGEL